MTFYRGYDSKYGFFSKHSFVWISSDKDYASEYGDSVKSCCIDFNKLSFANISALEDICSELDYDYLDAIYNPTEEMADLLRTLGVNAYTIEPMDYKYFVLYGLVIVPNLAHHIFSYMFLQLSFYWLHFLHHI